ncbi:Y4yA family PLP-dependent enzyme [Salmonella enterica]|nr:Y4yA family PLP-dependent enzyme [Salmonella enterica]EAX6581730.1 Y4yA family PLP-dependent enzyme [Salmonella enterica]
MASLLNINRQRNASWQVIPASELPPDLDPVISDWLQRSADSLVSLMEMHGSPLHIVWPHTVEANLKAMREVTLRFAVESSFYYGVKVNKSQALLEAAVRAGAGADVSSPQELEDALRAGCAGSQLCATGPAKTRDFLHALMFHRARIVIDSAQELREILRLTKSGRANSHRVPILLRLRPDACRASRFGIPEAEMATLLAEVAACERLHLLGFHFHLSGYAPDSRVRAFFEVVALLHYARRLGLKPEVIDIGGGIPVQYVESGRYKRWFAAQGPGDYRTGLVPSSFYPYGGELGPAQWLTHFLSGRNDEGETVASLLRKEGITLCLEPGRSLVDQSAISVFRVNRVTPTADYASVIFVEGSSFSACETWFNSEFLVDPLHVRCAVSAEPPTPGKAWIAGHSCLDEDVLTNRLVCFQNLPQPGDLLVFANTAGYQMDLLENRFHRHPFPARLTAAVRTGNKVIFSIDS